MSQEMEHRDWCEKEMTANEKARDTRSSTETRHRTRRSHRRVASGRLRGPWARLVQVETPWGMGKRKMYAKTINRPGGLLRSIDFFDTKGASLGFQVYTFLFSQCRISQMGWSALGFPR